MVDIYTLRARQPIVAKETYPTLKRRLFDSQAFMEVTMTDGKKVILAKNDIKKVEGH